MAVEIIPAAAWTSNAIPADSLNWMGDVYYDRNNGQSGTCGPGIPNWASHFPIVPTTIVRELPDVTSAPADALDIGTVEGVTLSVGYYMYPPNGTSYAACVGSAVFYQPTWTATLLGAGVQPVISDAYSHTWYLGIFAPGDLPTGLSIQYDFVDTSYVGIQNYLAATIYRIPPPEDPPPPDVPPAPVIDPPPEPVFVEPNATLGVAGTGIVRVGPRTG